ncbi:MAG: hypothetical protein QXF04_02635 [Candidatus Aenigmatarchaeota archaeon]|nr:hypothetical protein [Candidatus Aenigmarchaeota archaeon]
MIPIRTLIIIFLIIIAIIFLISIIFAFFKGGGVAQVFYEFCKITIGNIPFIGESICETLIRGI